MSEIRETDFTVIETEETFTSGGAQCAATVYRPRGITGPTPVVVMGHGVTLTRRDGIPAFARQFAATGCSVVAFDYRHWGDSDGRPRGWFSFSRRPVTMPVAGRPGDFAVLPAPEALPGFAHITAGRPWRNEISTSWLSPLAAFRPVTAVPKISAPVLYQIARHDGMPSSGQVDKAIPRTARAEVKRYPMDHFGPFSPEHQPAVAADASDFLRTHLAT
jgi:hypothetical protein